MISEKIKQLLKLLNNSGYFPKLENRNSKSDGFENPSTKYDGKTISLYEKYEYYNWGAFDYRLWKKITFFSDANILHELGHYCFASEDQRKLVNYGLGNPINIQYKKNFPNENYIQDSLADKFAIYFGKLFNICPIDNTLPFSEDLITWKVWERLNDKYNRDFELDINEVNIRFDKFLNSILL